MVSIRGRNVGGTLLSAAFDLDFIFETHSHRLYLHRATAKPKINFKSGGQECPPHTLC
jgi:hypothetical protein